MVGYSRKIDPEHSAQAIGRELRISVKHSVEICSALRGMNIEKAKNYLEDVIKLEKPVPFRRYKRCVGHRKGKGFGPGRFPQVAAKAILRLIESAESNAEYKGLDPDNMVITHISANRGRVFEGWQPRARGRSTPWNVETTNVEIILKEMEE
jgi:large subunit ribosomal protein L22